MMTAGSETADVLAKYGRKTQNAHAEEIARIYRSLHESQWRTPVESQLNFARRLVVHASKHVPFYRRLYEGEVQIERWEDLRSLPIVSRAVYSEASDDERKASRTLPNSQPLYYSPTSGTTSAMVWIAQTRLASAWRCACLLREFEWMGVDPSGDCAICRQPVSHDSPLWDDEIGAEVMPSWLDTSLKELVGIGKGYRFDIGLPIQKIADSIRKLQPAFILGTPSFFLSIAEQLEGFRPKVVLTISEQLFPDAREALSEAYQAPVFDSYAAVEVNRAAADCPEGGGYHVHDENVLLEVLDDDGNPLGPGGTGRVVVTALDNFATPIIRYELGDLAEVGEKCDCGRGLLRIAKWHGRQVSRMRLEGGRYRVATSLILTLRDLPEMKQVQILQDTFDQFTVKFVAPRDLAKEEKANVSNVFSQLAERDVVVRFQKVDRIEPLPNGKTPAFVVSPALQD